MRRFKYVQLPNPCEMPSFSVIERMDLAAILYLLETSRLLSSF